MKIFLGSLDISFGILFLILPIIFIEFARQRDFIKASLLLLLGIFLILTSDTFKVQQVFILVLNSLIITILVYEVFLNRWIELSEKEKKEFLSLQSIKIKLILFFDAIKKIFQNIYIHFSRMNFLKKNIPSKKWVRSPNKNSNNKTEKVKFNSSSLESKSTNIPKKDII